MAKSIEKNQLKIKTALKNLIEKIELTKNDEVKKIQQQVSSKSKAKADKRLKEKPGKN